MREFLAQIGTLLTGRAAATAITLAAVPIISRLFNPDDFGLAALLVSVALVIGPVVSLRYDRAILIARDDGCIDRLVWLCLATMTVLVIIVAMVIVPVAIATNDDAGRLGIWWIALVPMLALTGLANVQDAILTRRHQYRALAVADVANAGGASGVRVALGALGGSSVWALNVGYLIGLIARVAVPFVASRRGLHSIDAHPSREELKQLMREYRDFPLLNAPGELVRAVSANMPVLALSLLFNSAVVGYFSMANRAVQVPLNNFANIIRRVYQQRLVSKFERGEPIRRDVMMTTASVAAVGLVPFLIIQFWGEVLLTALLGHGWEVAGRFVEILSVWLFAVWVTVPASTVYLIVRSQGLWLAFQTSMSVFRAGGFAYAFVTDMTAEDVLLLFVWIGVIFQLAILVSGIYKACPAQPSRPMM